MQNNWCVCSLPCSKKCHMSWFGFLFLFTRFHGLFPFIRFTRLLLRCSPRIAYLWFPAIKKPPMAVAEFGPSCAHLSYFLCAFTFIYGIVNRAAKWLYSVEKKKDI